MIWAWEGCVCIIIVMCKYRSLSKYHIAGNYFEGITTFIRGRNIFVE